MALTRRLFAFGVAGFALATTAANAAPGDELIGTWEGTLTPVTGAGLIDPPYDLGPLRIVITREGAQVFKLRDGAFVEVKPGTFRIGRLGANAVVASLDASSPLGQGWAETWSFALTLRGANAISVVFTRQVNNMQEDPNSPDAIFSVVHTGEMQRVFPDHV